MTHGQPLLMLVEDDDDHAELVEFSLEECEGPPLIERARDGQEALDKLLASSGSDAQRPTLVLLDLNLPKVNGIEVLSQIKSNSALRGIPVVILSTSGSSRDRQRAYDNFANAYLVKPTEFESFNEMIQSVWAFWGTWNQRA